MTTGPATAPTSARRDEILAIAADRFATRGYATTTVREIADAAGILSGSLYHHFDSKETMVDEVLRVFLDDVLARYRRAIEENDGAVARLRALVITAFGVLVDHRSAVTVMMSEYTMLVQSSRFSYLREAIDETERLWVGVLEDGMRAGDLRADIDPRLIYRFIRDAIWSMRWYREEEYRPDDVAPFYLAVLLGGVATDGGSRKPTSARGASR